MGDPRRIVVVTGAGASRPLGVGSPMPLMRDWVTSLRADLEASQSGSADVIGLVDDLEGDDFEARLGEFLAFQASLPRTFALARLGSQDPRQDHAYFADWWNNANNRSTNIVEIIRRNLFENFGLPRFDSGLAEQAYGTLRERLSRGTDTTFLWFATTNYDAAIEVAMTRLGLRVLDGFVAPSPYATPVLDPLSLAEEAIQANDRVPVLHLHGAVGWYLTDRGIEKHNADQAYNSTLGTPALLLPDSTKSVDSLTGAERLWDEFRLLLDNSTHVLVLGHSLHDKHLVDVIDGITSPVAVAAYATGPELMDHSVRAKSEDYVHEFLPNATVIPWDFGPEAQMDQARLEEWLSQ